MAMTKEELMAQCFIVSTEEQYDKFVEERGIPQSKKKFPGGGSVLWLGSPSAKRVALYVHGGGLVMSATSFHMSFLKRIQEAAAGGDDESFAVAILAYP
ncbi:hypothetical protein NQ176_g659 [Zarea fungicola]|uniref:Uncharacterized protein n=1 Tax=Zarea fungicola TaxID=93591 RepID=A0ACC1NVW5_9HYPO|nr:hypothetical protein NQ176_g659 [Lecanicillium fungicola]